MHENFTETVQNIIGWAKEDDNIRGLVVIGSQARLTPPADQWSDLDIMVLAADPVPLLAETDWKARFGQVVCTFEETVPLHGCRWQWRVRRVLYGDGRDVDFSILPFTHLEEVLGATRQMLCSGYQVLYAAAGVDLDQRIAAYLGRAEEEEDRLPGEEALNTVIGDLLFHVVWAAKKIKRNELWVAVNCINGYMKDRLLRLIEAYNTCASQRASSQQASRQQAKRLGTNGRFLEEYSDPQICEKLRFCFTRYDAEEAEETLGYLIYFIEALAQAIYARNGYRLDARPFAQVKELYAGMIAR